MDRVKGQVVLWRSCRHVRALFRRHLGADTTLIEDAANGAAIIDALRHECPGIVLVQPLGGKLARAQAVQPLVEGGHVYLPKPRPYGVFDPARSWVDDFIHNLDGLSARRA